MIVECTECQTRFQLDDARVPASGIRVRCSRCKHAFFLRPPGSDDADAVHEVASEAAQAEAVPPPGSTQDLGAPAEERAPGGGDDEQDWQFNDAIPGEAGDEAGSGLDLASDPEPSIAAADDTGFEVDPGPEVSFGDVGLDVAATEPLGERDLESFGNLDELESLADETETDSAPTASAAADPELDDPESWDLLGEDSSGAAAQDWSDPPAVASRPVVGWSPSEPAGLDVLPTAPAGPGWIGRSAGRLANLAGWIAVAGLLAAGLVRGLAPSTARPRDAGVALEGGATPRGLEARWIDTARGGTLLVVEGELEAPTDRSLAPVGPLELVLLGADGSPLDVAAAPLARPQPESTLREASPPVLQLARAAAAADLAGWALAPGQSIAFQAVVEDVPLEARRFTIRAGEAAAPGGAAASAAVAQADLESDGAGAPAALAAGAIDTAVVQDAAPVAEAGSAADSAAGNEVSEGFADPGASGWGAEGWAEGDATSGASPR